MKPPGSDASERSLDATSPAPTVPPPDPNRLASESRTTVDLRHGVCTCGCRNPTAGHFVPGHNMRLRGALTRSYQLAQLVRVMQSFGEPLLVAAPAAAEALGPEWLAWVAPEVQVLRDIDATALDITANEFEGGL